MTRASLSRRLRFVAVLAVAAACTPSYTRWTNGASDPAAPAVVFLGDSLTAGQGVSSEEAYPALVAARMRAAGIQLPVVNAGVSGDTTGAGLSRLGRILGEPVAVLVLALGANDGLSRVPLETIRGNLSQAVERAQAAGARVVMVRMKLPLSFDPAYRAGFEQVFADLAEQYRLAFVPFLLEGVGGAPRLNQADGIHPTAEGQRIMANVVWHKVFALRSISAASSIGRALFSATQADLTGSARAGHAARQGRAMRHHDGFLKVGTTFVFGTILLVFLLLGSSMVLGEANTQPALAQLDSIYRELDALYVDLHQTPELSSHEDKPAAKGAKETRAAKATDTEDAGEPAAKPARAAKPKAATEDGDEAAAKPARAAKAKAAAEDTEEPAAKPAKATASRARKPATAATEPADDAGGDEERPAVKQRSSQTSRKTASSGSGAEQKEEQE